MKENTKIYNCSFEATLDIIGGKWKILILWYLGKHGILRNGELVRLLPNISQKMLTQQLRELENNELITRIVYDIVPPKVEYLLTEDGKNLLPIVEAMRNWGIEYTTKHNIKLLKNSK